MTQFVRKLDHMGRIVLPAEYRKKTGIDDLAEVRITEKDGKIIIEKLSDDDKISELCILSLRLTDGISEKEFLHKFGIDIYEKYKDSIDKNISSGLLKRENGHIFLTDYGFDFANTVMEEFI